MFNKIHIIKLLPIFWVLFPSVILATDKGIRFVDAEFRMDWDGDGEGDLPSPQITFENNVRTDGGFSLGARQKCPMGVEINLRGSFDNSSIAGGGPYESTKSIATASLSDGFSEDILSDEELINLLLEFGSIPAGSAEGFAFSVIPIRRGMHQVILRADNDLFDPNEANNYFVFKCETSGPEIEVNGRTNNLMTTTAQPITIKLSNNLDPSFVPESGQSLDYFAFAETSDGNVFSWSLSAGWQPGMHVAAMAPAVDFEGFSILDGLPLPVGRFKLKFCLDLQPNNIFNREAAYCDELELTIEPKL